MKFTKISDFQNLSSEMVENEILITRKRIFDLKVSFKLKRENKSHLLNFEKKKLAQLLTVKRNKIF